MSKEHIEHIEREAAKERLRIWITDCLLNEANEAADCFKLCIDLLDSIPAADVVEVVRCRECKYWGDEDGKLQRSDGLLFARCIIHNYLLDGRHTGWCPTENDFCSYGERKEGADNG